MYQSIYQYAVKNNLTTIKNRKSRTIAAYILLDSNSNYFGFEKCEPGYKSICPDTGTFEPTPTGSSYICDKFDTIFTTEKCDSKYIKKHKTYMSLLESSKSANCINTILSFLNSVYSDKKLLEEIRLNGIKNRLKDDSVISFKINGNKIEENCEWCDWFDSFMMEWSNKDKDNTITAISCISGGKVNPIYKNVFPKINVPQASTGSYVASFKYNAFESYDFVAGLNSAMSSEEAEAIKAGIEFLLTSDNNHSNEFGLIYWCEEDIPENTILNFSVKQIFDDEEDDEDNTERSAKYNEELKNVLTFFEKRYKISKGSNARFHTIEFDVTGKGRILFSNEQDIEYNDLYENIKRWYEDTNIKYSMNHDKSACYIKNVLFSLLYREKVQKKYDEAKKEYGKNIQGILYSMLYNKPVPEIIYYHALNKFEKSVIGGYFSNSNGDDIYIHNQTMTALNIIKAYLIRKKGEDYQPMLDEGIINRGYLCGRYLAVIGRMQEASLYNSNKRVNLSIDRKYYKAARQSPARAFGQCAKNITVYLNRLPESSKIYFTKLMSEISGKLCGEFPAQLTIDEQGAFDLGYAQQYHSFRMKKKENNNNENIKEANEEKEQN